MQGLPTIRTAILCTIVLGFAATTPSDARADFTQQAKLVGTGTSGTSFQGRAVALSADGNTAIVGASQDGSSVGAAWIFTRVDGVWSQQGTKLVGSGAVGNSLQGQSVAISADGNTVLIGGNGDNSAIGAAWVFTRSGGVWTQQGDKLVGTGGVGAPRQGWSVALSGDGNTAAIGAPYDNTAVVSVGATWIFTRSGGVWTQQGSKLVGTGAVSGATQGSAVALSTDGNTLLVGGASDNNERGAAWVFTRSAGTWAQQGSKLVGTGFVNQPRQGYSVALSGDGDTAIIGGYSDNGNNYISPGAAWVFARSGGVWTQQGAKLVGTGAVGTATQGWSVALSGDGNTALVGGNRDDSDGFNGVGATWVFTRSAGVWTQQGSKLVGTGAIGRAEQAYSVALSTDGRTAIVGGYNDNSGKGAAWVFVAPSRVAHDFDGNGKSDIVWRENGGSVAVWLMNGGTVVSAGALGVIANAWQIAGQRDFDGDGKADLLWRDGSGNTAIWFMNGAAVASAASVGVIAPSWSVAGTRDMNGDGKGDILWRDTSGNVAVWLMNGASVTAAAGLGNVAPSYTVAAHADFNGDGKADILWRDGSGNTSIWFMDGTSVASAAFVATVGPPWSVAATGDFNGDGKADILWRDTSGNTASWLMNGASVAEAAGYGVIADGWTIVMAGDYDGDGKADILWRNTSAGDTAIWFMNGTGVAGAASVANVASTWTIQATNAN